MYYLDSLFDSKKANKIQIQIGYLSELGHIQIVYVGILISKTPPLPALRSVIYTSILGRRLNAQQCIKIPLKPMAYIFNWIIYNILLIPIVKGEGGEG